MKRALASHLDFLRTHGVHGVLALGSTGEFPRFSLEERKDLLEVIVDLAPPLSVIANISDIRPQAVIELGKYARKLGIPAVAIMPPNFFPMSQADLLEFFLRTAEAVKLPVFLYNFPELTGNRIGLETIAAFAARAPMVGIKQSGGEFAYHQPLISLGQKKNFAVFSGSDTRLPEVFGLGVAGCIGGLVNIVPEVMVEIFHRCKGPNPSDPTDAAEKMKEVGDVINRLTFPLNVAAGLEARGLTPGEPKTVVSPESARLYRGIVKEFRALFRKWKLPPASGETRGSGRRAG